MDVRRRLKVRVTPLLLAHRAAQAESAVAHQNYSLQRRDYMPYTQSQTVLNHEAPDKHDVFSVFVLVVRFVVFGVALTLRLGIHRCNQRFHITKRISKGMPASRVALDL